MNFRSALPLQVILRGLTVLAVAVALLVRGSSTAESFVAKPALSTNAAAASKLATFSVAERIAKGPTLLLVALPDGGSKLALEARRWVCVAIFAPCSREPTFPEVLVPRHRIPRLGSEEPPWSASVSI